jgi:hypothetical protein
MQIISPHIPLGIPTIDAEQLLRVFSPGVPIYADEKGSLALFHSGVAVTVHLTDGMVTSVLYNDPTGRDSESSREAKVAAYLARYGEAVFWERRMVNGWMHYWFNTRAGAAMVYGIHKDVIRFNTWQPPESVA